MLKISRLTDYGLLATLFLVRRQGEVISAREIAHFYHLPLPMITKVLKRLHHGGLVLSHRGAGGGYSFDSDATIITMGDLIAVLEGPWDLTECETLDDRGDAICSIRTGCPSRRFMSNINRAIKGAFDQITLADLARGTMPGPIVQKELLDVRSRTNATS
jgi:Rrf2 family protein